MTIAVRFHLFPSRTQKLSSQTPKILGGRLPGKIGSRWFEEALRRVLLLLCKEVARKFGFCISSFHRIFTDYSLVFFCLSVIILLSIISIIVLYRGVDIMKVTFNTDKEIVEAIKEGLKQTGGYCPCRVERTPDTKCICKEFRDQIADPDFEGLCHCMLYYKSK